MRALFAGYGSIARRHIANLRAVCEARGECLDVDLLRHAPDSVPVGVRAAFASPAELPGGYDAVFVTNPTALHHETLLSLLGQADVFFVEKPVFDRTDVDASAFDIPGKAFYVACPLRYCSVLRWAKENIDFSRAVALRCISSSYLPDWRPGQDYRDTYSAHADMGGGAHVDLIHEWDYITHLVGRPHSVRSLIVKRSALEVDSPDVALYVADYGDKTVELHLDYYGRATQRRMEVYTDEDTVVCDIANGCVDFLKSSRHVDLREERDEWQRREIEHFLDIAEGRVASDNGIREAISVLRIAKGEMG